MIRDAIRPGVYKHYKGNIYEVYELAQHSETSELLVVYRPSYGEKKLWVRPLSMFQELVEVNGVKLARFEYLKPLKHGSNQNDFS